MKISVILTSLFLFIISLIHLLRVLFQIKVSAGSYEIPIWMSIPAFLVTLFLALFLIFEEKKKTQK